MYMYCIERSTRITNVNNICFCHVAVSDDISIFSLMVTMVADFCSLVILIHNTLQGKITISSTCRQSHMPSLQESSLFPPKMESGSGGISH